MKIWKKHWHISRSAVCLACEEKTEVIRCTECKADLPDSSFDPEKLCVWKKNYHISRNAICLTCEEKPKTNLIRCTECKADLPNSSFDPEKLTVWQKNCHVIRDAICLTCAEKPKAPPKDKAIRCIECKADLPNSGFDPEKLTVWQKSCNIARDAICLSCEAKISAVKLKATNAKMLKCVYCEKEKNRSDFDKIMIERWTKNRDLAKKAECKSCAAVRGVRTHEPKRGWQHAKFTCNQSEPSYIRNKKTRPKILSNTAFMLSLIFSSLGLADTSYKTKNMSEVSS